MSRNAFRWSSRVAPVLLLCLLALACSASGDGQAGGGEEFPDVALDPVGGGEPVDLGELASDAVVVNLWATWCAPCRAELSTFEAAHRELGGQVRFIGVNVGETADAAQELVSELDLTFEQLLDVDSSLNAELEVVQMPSTVFVGARGEILDTHIGAVSADQLEDLLSEHFEIS